MQVELAATLGLSVLAGSPDVHMALTDRTTAKSIFMTAGVGSPPFVPIIAASSRSPQAQADHLQLVEGSLNERRASDRGCPMPGAAGHTHCAACHPAEARWVEMRQDVPKTAEGQNAGADTRAASLHKNEQGKHPNQAGFEADAHLQEASSAACQPGQLAGQDAGQNTVEDRAPAIHTSQPLQSRRSSLRHEAVIAEVSRQLSSNTRLASW